MNSITAEEVARGLEAARPSGAGWIACCPAHDDRKPSLSITDCEDGRLLVHCHAGCGQADVIKTLKHLGLWPHSDSVPVPAPIHGNGNGNASRTPKTRPRPPEGSYLYHDRDGKEVLAVHRTADKKFSQWTPASEGGWDPKGMCGNRPLYRLPAVISGPGPVLIVEGEKDVETAHRTFPNWTVTTWAGGSKAVHKTDWTPLAGRSICLLSDGDDTGRKAMEQIGAQLVKLGCTVEIARNPGTDGNDLSDLIERYGADDARHILNDMLEPFEAGQSEPDNAEEDFNFLSAAELLNRKYSAPEWLVEDMLPLGGLSIMSARPKVGKSTLARCLALSVARDYRWLDRNVDGGPVLYCALEEIERKVQEHFRAMGMKASDPIHVHVGHPPSNGIRKLEAAVAAYKPRLIIVDPLLHLMSVDDLNDYAKVTFGLSPFLELARNGGTHIMLIHHNNKLEGNRGIEILGSTALLANIDTALLLQEGDTCRSLYTRQRYGRDLEAVSLDLDEDTGWVTTGRTVHEIRGSVVEDEILDFLVEKDQPIDADEIRQAVGRKASTVKKKLRGLVKDRRVERCGGGKRGDPYKYSVPIPEY